MNRVSDDLLASMLNEAANEDWDDLVLALTELQSRRALEPQQEEAEPAVWIDPAELAELYAGSKHGYSTVYRSDEAAGLNTLDSETPIPLYAHPTPAQKVHESQTVSYPAAPEGWTATKPAYVRGDGKVAVEFVYGDKQQWHLRLRHGNGASHSIDKFDTANAALTAALESPHVTE